MLPLGLRTRHNKEFHCLLLSAAIQMSLTRLPMGPTQAHFGAVSQGHEAPRLVYNHLSPSNASALVHIQTRVLHMLLVT